MTEERIKEQNVTLQGRAKITVTGVSDVDSFDEHTVVLYTSLGILTIKGNDLHMNKLNVETGDLSIEGEIDGMAYAQQKTGKQGGGLLSKLFQ